MVRTEGIQKRIADVLKHQTGEMCFACGGTTALGRLMTHLNGQKVVSCWRSECMEALQKLVSGEASNALD